MLLIDDNQPEIFQRCEHGTAGANDDASAAGMDLMPFIMPFPLGQMTVQNRDHVLRFRKAAFESLDRLRSERNFGNEHDCGPITRQCLSNCMQIDFRFPTAGDAVQQNRFGSFRR